MIYLVTEVLVVLVAAVTEQMTMVLVNKQEPMDLVAALVEALAP